MYTYPTLSLVLLLVPCMMITLYLFSLLIVLYVCVCGITDVVGIIFCGDRFPSCNG